MIVIKLVVQDWAGALAQAARWASCGVLSNSFVSFEQADAFNHANRRRFLAGSLGLTFLLASFVHVFRLLVLFGRVAFDDLYHDFLIALGKFTVVVQAEERMTPAVLGPARGWDHWNVKVVAHFHIHSDDWRVKLLLLMFLSPAVSRLHQRTERAGA